MGLLAGSKRVDPRAVWIQTSGSENCVDPNEWIRELCGSERVDPRTVWIRTSGSESCVDPNEWIRELCGSERVDPNMWSRVLVGYGASGAHYMLESFTRAPFLHLLPRRPPHPHPPLPSVGLPRRKNEGEWRYVSWGGGRSRVAGG